MRSKFVFPMRVTQVNKAKHHVNLLYLEHEDKAHYVSVKDFDKVMFGHHNKHNKKKHFCQTCLHCFAKGETREEHKAKECYAVAGTRYEMPDPST